MTQMQSPPGAMMKPHRATLILVLGILSLVVCQICGIFAWIMGNADLRQMDAGQMDPAGRGMTQAGKICGMIGTILLGLSLVIGVLWLIFATVIVGAAAAGAHGTHP